MQQALKWVGIADNVSNAGAVLGTPVKEWRDVDLVAACGRLLINGELAGEGYGGDVMGHPFEALAWLANSLTKYGRTLTQGMIVLTGSLVVPKFLNPGDSTSFVVDGLGGVRLNVT